MKYYHAFLNAIEKAMAHDHTTSNVELERMGRQLFGTRFRGVFASDGFPALTSSQPYAIVNTKSAASGGEHWLGVARVPRTGRLLVYDSYGRTPTSLLRTLPPDSEDTELDAEQKLSHKKTADSEVLRFSSWSTRSAILPRARFNAAHRLSRCSCDISPTERRPSATRSPTRVSRCLPRALALRPSRSW